MNLLIENIAQLRDQVSFSGDINYSTLKPALRSAQEWLSRYVGTALLTELGTGSQSADQIALRPLVLAPIGALAMLKFSTAGTVRITDLGLMRTKTGDSNDAFEWQLDRVVNALKTEAFDGIETLLRYLEENKAKFGSYTASDAYKQQSGKLIQSAAVFNQYYDIGFSRLVLLTLQPSMRTAELSVRKILGTELITTLLAATSPTDLQSQQIDTARRALVYLTIARALREKLVSISDTGVQVCGISNFATINYKQPVSDKQLQTSIVYFDEQASQFLSELSGLIPIEPSAPVSTGVRVSGTAIVAF